MVATIEACAAQFACGNTNLVERRSAATNIP